MEDKRIFLLILRHVFSLLHIVAVKSIYDYDVDTNILTYQKQINSEIIVQWDKFPADSIYLLICTFTI